MEADAEQRQGEFRPPALHPSLRQIVEDHLDEGLTQNESLRRVLVAIDEILRFAESDRRLAEQSLEFSTQELLKAHEEVRGVLQAQPDIICLLDSKWKIRSCSTSSYRDLIHPPQMLIGRRMDRIPHPKVAKLFRAALEEARKTGRLQTIEYELAPKGTKHSYFEARMVPMGTDHCVVVIRNVDERKHLEAQLVQAQKLESIAHLAAGIAHEINTPTQYITDNTRFLQDTFGELDPILDAICRLGEQAETPDQEQTRDLRKELENLDLEYLREEIPQAIAQSLEGLERIARIVAAMKEFSHPGSEEMTPTDLNRALENTATVSKNEWKYVADLDLHLDPALPSVYCLPAELNQVFLNVIVNAAQAVGESVKQKIRPHGKITVKTKLDGRFAEIRISDTGLGVPESARDHIFDPFFTTKEVGIGTGQGLAISRSVVVDKHHGTIDFLTCPGEGTTFVIRIPVDGDAARLAAA